MVDRKRNVKTEGFSKLGYNCISKITIKSNKSHTKLDVHRIITHCAHSTVVKHLRMSMIAKKQIASKLVKGVSTDR